MTHGGKSKTKKPQINHLLESGSIKGLQEAKRLTEKHIRYRWKEYSELAQQRHEIQDKIKKALIQTCVPQTIDHWQRAVKYKYGLHPLSTAGSLTDIGGRFNTGKEVNTEVPSFSGLYIAQDKDTALQEHLGQIPNDKLTPREIALTNPASETIVSISGKLDKIFDLTKEETLEPFVKLIKKFKLSLELQTMAKELGLKAAKLINTQQKLMGSLLDPDWRKLPRLFDIPANSQIFGYLVFSAGIEGILYPSKLTQSPCLVLFPKNFPDTDSFIQLDDETPHDKVPNRIDGSNWRICDLSPTELLAL
ncbi:RES domain [Legionella steigerwaltii]|uniref:RES domain n=1 Tax=Legionella steigerwaltii TaxID=460 RepID=A0A378LEA7_9GAMM|nr:RES domain-containing protein [Legionella steigerwaltii]KTD78542.1 RES domain protein [Legionella steigerwaltii]STY24099.1 RES domain [Legionella steigerwaltii]